jgi:hypothetical protein
LSALIKNALVLLVEGKLFRDPRFFFRQLAIGVTATVAMMLIGSLVVTSPILVTLISGFVGGVLQPYLFENVRYR